MGQSKKGLFQKKIVILNTFNKQLSLVLIIKTTNTTIETQFAHFYIFHSKTMSKLQTITNIHIGIRILMIKLQFTQQSFLNLYHFDYN